MYGTKKCSIVLYGTKKCSIVMNGTKKCSTVPVCNKKSVPYFSSHLNEIRLKSIFQLSSHMKSAKFMARGLVTERIFSLVPSKINKL
jgi:hypothetical protein